MYLAPHPKRSPEKMLPKYLDDLLRERLGTELRWHTQNIESSRTRAVEKAHSLGNDPRTLVTMELIRESGSHIKKIYEVICDVVGQVGFDPYDDFSSDLVALFEAFSDEQVGHIQASLDSWHGKPHNPQIDKHDLRSTFTNIKDNYRVKIKTLASSILHPVKKKSKPESQSLDSVFIVHGHDDLAKTETARFVEKLGFTAIILHEQASGGKTIIEKIEAYANIGFGIVLYTPTRPPFTQASGGSLFRVSRK